MDIYPGADLYNLIILPYVGLAASVSFKGAYLPLKKKVGGETMSVSVVD